MPRGKNDNKPRGRMTAYAFFVQTCREEHKKKHPDENVVFAEFSKKCAERWKVNTVIFFILVMVEVNDNNKEDTLNIYIYIYIYCVCNYMYMSYF